MKITLTMVLECDEIPDKRYEWDEWLDQHCLHKEEDLISAEVKDEHGGLLYDIGGD